MITITISRNCAVFLSSVLPDKYPAAASTLLIHYTTGALIGLLPTYTLLRAQGRCMRCSLFFLLQETKVLCKWLLRLSSRYDITTDYICQQKESYFYRQRIGKCSIKCIDTLQILLMTLSNYCPSAAALNGSTFNPCICRNMLNKQVLATASPDGFCCQILHCTLWSVFALHKEFFTTLFLKQNTRNNNNWFDLYKIRCKITHFFVYTVSQLQRHFSDFALMSGILGWPTVNTTVWKSYQTMAFDTLLSFDFSSCISYECNR